MKRRDLLQLAALSTALKISCPAAAAEARAVPPEAQARKGFEALKRSHIISQTGVPFSLAQFGGKGLIVNFWANWCPNCVGEFQSMHTVQDAARRLAPFEVVLISQQKDWANDQAFAAQRQIGFPLYEHTWNNDDPREHADYMALACSFVLNGTMIDPMPLSYLIDKNGELIIVLRGGTNWTQQGLIPYILKSIHPENVVHSPWVD